MCTFRASTLFIGVVMCIRIKNKCLTKSSKYFNVYYYVPEKFVSASEVWKTESMKKKKSFYNFKDYTKKT